MGIIQATAQDRHHEFISIHEEGHAWELWKVIRQDHMQERRRMSVCAISLDGRFCYEKIA